jgi:hypothetical protein
MSLHLTLLLPLALYSPMTLWSVIPLFNNYPPLLSGSPNPGW